MQKNPKSYQALEFLPLVKFISMNLAKNCQILDSSRAQIKAFQPCFGGSPGKLGSVLKTRVIILHSWTLFSSSKAFKHNQFQHWKLTIFQLVSFEKCKQTDRGHPVMSHVFWGLWPLGDTWYNHLVQCMTCRIAIKITKVFQKLLENFFPIKKAACFKPPWN